MQSIVKSRNAAIPVFLEIGLDRILKDLSQRSIVHVLRFAWSGNIDLVGVDLIISAKTQCEEYEERNSRPHPLTILLDRLSRVAEKTSRQLWSVGRGHTRTHARMQASIHVYKHTMINTGRFIKTRYNFRLGFYITYVEQNKQKSTKEIKKTKQIFFKIKASLINLIIFINLIFLLQD